jgi:replication-associated recombination protein RarA
MKFKNETPPASYRPTTPAELIGQAGELAASSLRNVLRIKRDQNCSLKVCFYGPPGDGKSSIADMTAAALVDHPLDLERINGRNLTIDVVRDWERNSVYGSLFGGWRIKLIEEMDLVPMVAQDLLLTYLDRLPNGIAVIGTSNLNHDTLSERFRSRFQQIKVAPPTQDEIAFWLRDTWSLPKKAADWIALATCGNVREALLQADAFRTFGVLPEEKKIVPIKCASRSDAAKRAWETMREGKAVAA